MAAADDRTAAFALADAAVRRWVRDALAVSTEHEPLFDGVAGSLRDLHPVTNEATAEAAGEVAADVATLARPLPGQIDLAATARHAMASAEAAVEGRWNDAGTAAGESLYARIGAGTEYVITEAEALLGATGTANA